MYIYIYSIVCICVYMYIYIYICIEREMCLIVLLMGLRRHVLRRADERGGPRLLAYHIISYDIILH